MGWRFDYKDHGTFLSGRAVVFFARAVKMAHEAAELIEVHWVPITEACRQALCGELNDGKTVAGLLRAQAKLAAAGK